MKEALRSLSATKKVFYEDDISSVKEWPKFIANIPEVNPQLALFMLYLGTATEDLPTTGALFPKLIPMIFLTGITLLHTGSFPA